MEKSDYGPVTFTVYRPLRHKIANNSCQYLEISQNNFMTISLNAFRCHAQMTSKKGLIYIVLYLGQFVLNTKWLSVTEKIGFNVRREEFCSDLFFYARYNPLG